MGNGKGEGNDGKKKEKKIMMEKGRRGKDDRGRGKR